MSWNRADASREVKVRSDVRWAGVTRVASRAAVRVSIFTGVGLGCEG